MKFVSLFFILIILSRYPSKHHFSPSSYFLKFSFLKNYISSYKSDKLISITPTKVIIMPIITVIRLVITIITNNV